MAIKDSKMQNETHSEYCSLSNFDWQRFNKKVENLLNEIKSKKEAENTILVLNLIKTKDAQLINLESENE